MGRILSMVWGMPVYFSPPRASFGCVAILFIYRQMKPLPLPSPSFARAGARHMRQRVACLLGLLPLLGLYSAPSAPLSAEPVPAPETAPARSPAKPAFDRLIACPDCQQDVSRRALACPHCGCPGEAIAAAVREARAAEVAARPRPIVQITTDAGTGHGVIVAEGDAAHVLFDAALLTGAQSLSLTTISKAEPVSYSRLEVATDGPLARLTIPADAVARLPLAATSVGPAASGLSVTGLIIPQTTPIDASAAPFVAHLDAHGAVIALAPSSKGDAFIPVSRATRWTTVAPADYRAQIALLRRLRQNPVAAVSSADREALRSTAWLTPFLQQSADALLRSASQP